MRKVRWIGYVLAVMLVCASQAGVPQPANAVLPFWATFIIPFGINLLNKEASKPMERSTSDEVINANFTWKSTSLGVQYSDEIIPAVLQGVVIDYAVYLAAKPHLTNPVGLRITCENPLLGVIEVSQVKEERSGDQKKDPTTPHVRRLRVVRTYLDSAGEECQDIKNISSYGWRYVLDTSSLLPAGSGMMGFTMAVDCYFDNGTKQAGLFGTERVKYSDSVRRFVQLTVLNADSIKKAMNDPSVMEAMRWVHGLQPAIPSIGGGPQVKIDPAVYERLGVDSGPDNSTKTSISEAAMAKIASYGLVPDMLSASHEFISSGARGVKMPVVAVLLDGNGNLDATTNFYAETVDVFGNRFKTIPLAQDGILCLGELGLGARVSLYVNGVEATRTMEGLPLPITTRDGYGALVLIRSN